MDMWTEATRDFEQESSERELAEARIAASEVWPFLAAAKSEIDFANRLALVEDRIAEAAPDPSLRKRLEASLTEDFKAMASEDEDEDGGNPFAEGETEDETEDETEGDDESEDEESEDDESEESEESEDESDEDEDEGKEASRKVATPKVAQVPNPAYGAWGFTEMLLASNDHDTSFFTDRMNAAARERGIDPGKESDALDASRDVILDDAISGAGYEWEIVGNVIRIWPNNVSIDWPTTARRKTAADICPGRDPWFDSNGTAHAPHSYKGKGGKCIYCGQVASTASKTAAPPWMPRNGDKVKVKGRAGTVVGKGDQMGEFQVDFGNGTIEVVPRGEMTKASSKTAEYSEDRDSQWQQGYSKGLEDGLAGKPAMGFEFAPEDYPGGSDFGDGYKAGYRDGQFEAHSNTQPYHPESRYSHRRKTAFDAYNDYLNWSSYLNQLAEEGRVEVLQEEADALNAEIISGTYPHPSLDGAQISRDMVEDALRRAKEVAQRRRQMAQATRVTAAKRVLETGVSEPLPDGTLLDYRTAQSIVAMTEKAGK